MSYNPIDGFEPDNLSYWYLAYAPSVGFVSKSNRWTFTTLDAMTAEFTDEHLVKMCESCIIWMDEIQPMSPEIISSKTVSMHVEAAISASPEQENHRRRYINRLLEKTPELVALMELMK